MNRLILKINGQEHPYVNATVTFTLEKLADSFNATIPFQNIEEAVSIEWLLDNKTIFKGQLDTSHESIKATSEGLVIAGRSLSANFIDSTHKTDAYYDQSIQNLIKILVKDYGLKVKNNVTSKIEPVFEFQINAESAFSAIKQLAKQRNLILIEQNGTILIERPGQFGITNLALVDGENIETLDIKRDFTKRFYKYEIQGAWDDASATAYDFKINKNRISIIIADKLQDEDACKSRAQYEKNLAIALSLIADVTMPGLHDELTGNAINKTIKVKSTKRLFQEDLLIKTISLNVTDKLETTTVSLCRPFTELTNGNA